MPSVALTEIWEQSVKILKVQLNVGGNTASVQHWELGKVETTNQSTASTSRQWGTRTCFSLHGASEARTRHALCDIATIRCRMVGSSLSRDRRCGGDRFAHV